MNTLSLIATILASAAAIAASLGKAAKALWAVATAFRDLVDRLEKVLAVLESMSKVPAQAAAQAAAHTAAEAAAQAAAAATSHAMPPAST